MLTNQERETFLVNTRKLVESDEEGKILLEKTPVGSLFVYDQNSGEKLINWDLSGNILFVGEAYKTVIVDYWYSYDNGHTILTIGRPLMQGYLSLTGKMKVKDDITGKVKTGIINIPKLRLMSDLSMRVGSDAIPQVGRLDAVAVPEGARGQQKVMEIIFLNDDIDADM